MASKYDEHHRGKHTGLGTSPGYYMGVQRGLPAGRWLCPGPLGCLPAFPWSAHTGLLQASPKQVFSPQGAPLRPSLQDKCPAGSQHIHACGSLLEPVTLPRTQPRSPRGPLRLLGTAAPEAKPGSPSSRPRMRASLNSLLASSAPHLHTLSGGAATVGEPGP